MSKNILGALTLILVSHSALAEVIELPLGAEYNPTTKIYTINGYELPVENMKIEDSSYSFSVLGENVPEEYRRIFGRDDSLGLTNVSVKSIEKETRIDVSTKSKNAELVSAIKTVNSTYAKDIKSLEDLFSYSSSFDGSLYMHHSKGNEIELLKTELQNYGCALGNEGMTTKLGVKHEGRFTEPTTSNSFAEKLEALNGLQIMWGVDLSAVAEHSTKLNIDNLTASVANSYNPTCTTFNLDANKEILSNLQKALNALPLFSSQYPNAIGLLTHLGEYWKQILSNPYKSAQSNYSLDVLATINELKAATSRFINNTTPTLSETQ